jgi:hypothetical protein
MTPLTLSRGARRVARILSKSNPLNIRQLAKRDKIFMVEHRIK